MFSYPPSFDSDTMDPAHTAPELSYDASMVCEMVVPEFSCSDDSTLSFTMWKRTSCCCSSGDRSAKLSASGLIRLAALLTSSSFTGRKRVADVLVELSTRWSSPGSKQQ